MYRLRVFTLANNQPNNFYKYDLKVETSTEIFYPVYVYGSYIFEALKFSIDCRVERFEEMFGTSAVKFRILISNVENCRLLFRSHII